MIILVTRNSMHCWGEVGQILEDQPYRKEHIENRGADQKDRPVTIHQHGLNVIVFGGEAKFYTTEPEVSEPDQSP